MGLIEIFQDDSSKKLFDAARTQQMADGKNVAPATPAFGKVPFEPPKLPEVKAPNADPVDPYADEPDTELDAHDLAGNAPQPFWGGKKPYDDETENAAYEKQREETRAKAKAAADARPKLHLPAKEMSPYGWISPKG